MVYPYRNLVMKISLGIIPLVQMNATKWRFLKFTLREFKYWPQAEQLEPFDDTWNAHKFRPTFHVGFKSPSPYTQTPRKTTKKTQEHKLTTNDIVCDMPI